MRRFAAVALREVAERRFVLVAAAAAAVLPFLVAFLPSVPGSDAATARAVTALVLACTFGVGGAVLVGASVVGRELAEKRLSFHFARPLSAPVVWGGKLAGGLALVLLAELVVYLPASLASGRFPALLDGGDAPAMAALLLAAVPLFLVAWVCSVAVRSRSPWLVVDLLLLVGGVSAVTLLVRRLLFYALVPGPSAAVVFVGVVLAALLAGTFAQVAGGRTDARRGHGAQSLALWGVLLAGLVVGAVWVERIVDPGVGRLEGAWAEPAGPGGDWVVVDGGAPGSRWGIARYLVDLTSGRSIRLRPGSTTASKDGSRAAHVAWRTPGQKELELESIDLRSGASATFPLAEEPDGIDLTPDGRRLAVVAAGLVRVVELPSFRLLASARIPSEEWSHVPRFVTPDLVRVFPSRLRRTEDGEGPRTFGEPELLELDVARRAVAARARYELPSRPDEVTDPGRPARRRFFYFEPSPDRSRVLVTALGAVKGVRLLEAETGRALAALDGPAGPGQPRGAFLADGRLVLADPGQDGFRLDLLSPDGSRLASLPLPGASYGIRFGSEPAPGRVHVSLSKDENRMTWAWFLVDLAAGTATPLEGEQRQRYWWTGEWVCPPAGSPATRLLNDVDGRLVLLEPATGERRALTRGAPRRK